MWGKKTIVRTLGACAIIGGGLVTMGTGVGAQTPTTQTSTPQTCVTQEINARFFLNGPSESDVFAIDIPATTVAIPSAGARDFYPGRQAVNQKSERWQLQFLDVAGNVIAVSAPTEDVPDGEDDQSWVGPLADVPLSAPAAGIRAVHRPDLPADGQAMSVWATGITLCWSATSSVPVCPPDAAGNPQTTDASGNCAGPSTPPPPGPTAPQPAPPPSGPTTCGTDAAGATIPRSTDGTCPTSPPYPPSPPSTPDPAGPSLPVTGLESTLLLALTGLFLTAAGFSLVLRPGSVNGLD